jgi:hypothetical protein
MTTGKRYNRQEIRHTMNLALDNMLPASAEDALEDHLAASRKDARLFEGMQTVDRLFASEPQLRAPTNFAANVMAAIAVGKSPQPVAHRTDLRAVLGLILATIILLPVFLLTMSYVHQLLTDQAAFNLLTQRIIWLFNILVRSLASLVEAIAASANGNLLALGALSAALFTAVFWTGFNRVFWSRRQLVVYRIPVQFA